MTYRLLDLFCGAGGATKGYQRAGFYVVGVDIKPQPNYCGDEFIQGDAFEVLEAAPMGAFDVVHASPPCQRFIGTGMIDRSKYPDLLTPIRERLRWLGLPWVIENVPGAPMRPDVILCGSMFGLGVRRHRWFEGSPSAGLTPWVVACNHDRPAIGVYGHPRGNAKWGRGTAADWPRAMGIDWMTTEEISQAIPPAYTHLIGSQLRASLAAWAMTP